MSTDLPDTSELLASAREHELEEARKKRDRDKRYKQLRQENKMLNQRVDVLEDHLSVREDLASALRNPPTVKIKKQKGRGDPVIPIAPNSDEHYDETFTLEQTGGHNEQNPDLAEEKVERYTERLIRLAERDAMDNPQPAMILPFMGDMISGELHDKDERVSPMTPHEAARMAYRFKRRIIDTLLDKGPSEKLVIPCVDGNHGRSTARRTPGLNQRYSFEHDVYLRLAEYYFDEDEDRVQFYIPQSDFLAMEVVPGFTICITHGDSVKGGGGIGGLAPSLLRAVTRWKDSYPADFYMLGHFHQYWDLGSVAVNPSAVGYNPFAASLGLQPSPPAQLYTALHTGHMARAMTAQIWLD